ncbi:hypothetical protein J2Y46_004074 [Microbacterium sp. BE35]|uniref:DUF4082 domain-containing protein n=1 Tax=Microbacterium sp. BE35 TaxID=2817773 RepID=UPI002854B8A7|nr:DUF4082 domain-containing protein [Microbacterium sp. BE35]MDR7191212.1 hypothetical protein [Microbacterium sp. BE35]
MSRKALRARLRLRTRIRRANIGFTALVAGVLVAAGFAVVPAIAAPTTTGIFADDLQPKIAADSDRTAVELGVKFSPDKSGTVTALQYYQGKGAKNVTTATLWSSDGTVLSQVSFTASTTVGWRTVALSKPVTLTAGASYVASYNAPSGGYAVTENDLTRTRVQNGFTLKSGAGVYRYGATGKVPTSTYSGSNYLVDIVYKPSTTATPSPTATATPKPTVTPTPTATPKPTPTPTTTPKPTPSPTPTATPTPTPTPPTTTPPTTTPPPSSSGGTVVLGRSFPNANTTGVPAGTTLTKYTGPCTIQTAGYVIDGKQVDCSLRILAKDVVIKNSKINGTVYADYTQNQGSFTITDSEVDAGDGPWTGIGDAWFTATRVEVTGGTRSINCYANCTVRDSYVHGQLHDTTGVHHESGIRINTNSSLIGNTIACDAPDFPPDAGCSAAITGYPDFDPVQNNTVDGNLIIAGSGGYCSYGGSTAGKPYSGQTKNIKFTNNVYQKGSSGKCGFWGAITSFDRNAPGNVWTNNLYDDGTAVAPAN